MKFEFLKAIGLSVFGQLLKTCNTKAKGEPDSEFLFTIKGGQLYARSSNDKSEQTILLETTRLQGDDGDSFSANGSSLLEFVRLFPASDLVCKYVKDQNSVIVGSSQHSSRLILPTPAETDFVPLRFNPQGEELEVDGVKLADALRSTAFAAATDAALAPKTAVHLVFTEAGLTAEAMDDYRISSYSIEQENAGLKKIELLIPRETAETIASLVESSGDVTLCPGVSHLKIKWEGTEYISRLESLGAGKKFPAVHTLLDQEPTSKIKVSRAEMQRVLKTAALVARDSYVEIAIEGDSLVVSRTDADKGAIRDSVVGQEIEGDALITYVGWKHIAKGIDSAKDAWVWLLFKLFNNGTIGIEIQDGNYSHMVLPVVPSDLADEEEVDSDGSEESEEAS